MYPYDGHIHTNLSTGRDSVAEVVRQAEAGGLELVVIADHYWPEDADLIERARHVVAANAISPVCVVLGAEVSILDSEGLLELDETEVRLAQWVLASLGGRTRGIGLDPPANLTRFFDNVFRSLLQVIQHPLVDVIAHPFNLGRFPAVATPGQLPRSGLREVAAAMSEYDVAFEIDNQMSWWFPDMPVLQFSYEYADLLALFAGANVKFVPGSDAQCAGAVGNLRWCQRIMQMAGIEKSQTLNLPRRFGPDAAAH
jgi:histidinol phosphatase-like PHP family hydrolase